MSKRKRAKHFNEAPPKPEHDPLLLPSYLVCAPAKPKKDKRKPHILRSIWERATT